MKYSQSSPDHFVEEMRVTRFQELRSYQMALGFQQKIFELSKKFPKVESYSLTDQIRRSSRSIGASIAEAWQKRVYPAHFKSKLTDATAELAETQHWIQTAFNCGYLTEAESTDLLSTSIHLGNMLGRMIKSHTSFCNPN